MRFQIEDLKFEMRQSRVPADAGVGAVDGMASQQESSGRLGEKAAER
jgi:hypothetical protein